jgi:hypothetical protein
MFALWRSDKDNDTFTVDLKMVNEQVLTFEVRPIIRTADALIHLPFVVG